MAVVNGPDARDVDAACRRHEDVAKAVAEPGSTGPGTVALCLSPTRSNMLDQAVTLPGDCVDVTVKGSTITRQDCAAPDAWQQVLAVERQNTVPVTSACRAHREGHERSDDLPRPEVTHAAIRGSSA